MAIILLTKIKQLFKSIHFQVALAFLLIVGVSCIVVSSTLVGMVGDYLFDERIRSDRLMMETLADSVSAQAAPLDGPDAGTRVYASVMETSSRLEDARILLLDNASVVRLDTELELAGLRWQTDETDAVLYRGQMSTVAVYNELTKEKLDTTALVFSDPSSANWSVYIAVPLVDDTRVTGALQLIQPVRDMMGNLYEMQSQMFMIYGIMAVAVLIFALFISHFITRPVKSLTGGIHKMGRGDFSTRVPVKGTEEMRRMAEAFNTMSERIESLDASRNQFVSNASHELNTPLATMKILIESLIYQPDMDRELRTEFMTDINKEIDRLSAIVSDLLTLVRIDSNSARLARENLSLAAIVKETEHRLLPIVKKRGQSITLSLSDSCDMYADKGKLTQVVYNLMENAVKYTQEGGEIRVTLSRQGRDAHLVVTDNGPGIAKEYLPYIFDRFYRVDKARSRETGGTGLGLSIVHQLILLHSGSIRVESEVGKGTSFIVDLPLHHDVAE